MRLLVQKSRWHIGPWQRLSDRVQTVTGRMKTRSQPRATLVGSCGAERLGPKRRRRRAARQLTGLLSAVVGEGSFG